MLDYRTKSLHYNFNIIFICFLLFVVVSTLLVQYFIVMLTIKTLAGFYLVGYEMMYIILES